MGFLGISCTSVTPFQLLYTAYLYLEVVRNYIQFFYIMGGIYPTTLSQPVS